MHTPEPQPTLQLKYYACDRDGCHQVFANKSNLNKHLSKNRCSSQKYTKMSFFAETSPKIITKMSSETQGFLDRINPKTTVQSESLLLDVSRTPIAVLKNIREELDLSVA